MLPKQKVSRGRTRRGRSHHALRSTHTVTCPNCGSAKLPHVACKDCGYVRPGLSLKLNEED